MTETEAQAVELALRILHQQGDTDQALGWLNRACATHQFELAYRRRNPVITVRPVRPETAP